MELGSFFTDSNPTLDYALCRQVNTADHTAMPDTDHGARHNDKMISKRKNQVGW
jgi:hypothetical protein